MQKRTVAPAVVLFLGIFLISPSWAQPIPPNVKLNTDGTFELQNEEQVWINLTDSLNVIADWRDFRLGYRRVGLGISNDGGATWTDQLVTPLIFTHQSDPCLVGDNTGRFFMNMLDYDRNDRYNFKSHIVVHVSTDKGQSWAPPVPIQPLGPVFEDKQFTAVDRTGGLYDGYYYVSWTRFPNPDRMIFVRSTDGAQTFDDTLTVGPVVQTACGTYDQGQFSIPIVNSDGSVHVFWQGADWDSAACTGVRAIRRARSIDGGATFTKDSVAFLTTLGYWDVDGNIDVYGMPNGDADISGGPYDGSIYIARTEFTSDLSGETNVVVHKSTDNGITWLDTVTVNDDPPGQNIDQFHPWLIVNEDGTILTIFYDQRNDPVGHYLFDCYFSASFDGAETFVHNYRLSSVSSSPAGLAARNLAEARNFLDPYPGGTDPTATLAPMAGAIAEYIGVHAKHDYVVAVWTDTRDGTQDVYSTRFTVPFMPPRLYLPVDGLVTPATMPDFRWSTCWHETADSYRIEIASDSSFAVIQHTSAGLLDNNYTPALALPGGLHYWRVKAFRTAGDSTEYSEVYEFTSGCEAGAPPELLLPPPDSGTANDTSALLVWDPVGDATGYRMQLSLDSEFTSIILDTALTATECTVSGLVDATTYFWRVSSTNACGTGAWSLGRFTVALCPIVVAGDVDETGTITAADIIVMVTHVFKSGPPPQPCAANGDVNCSGSNDAGDVVYLVGHVFKAGPPPCDICSDSPLECIP